MSENEYVATAAAEKRLREVLEARLAPYCEEDRNGVTADNLAFMLLDGAKIEYKARAKQVVISLDLPDTATTAKPKAATETADPGTTGVVDPATGTEEPNTIAPQPHIAKFVPSADYEPTEDDVHYD